jgi:Acyl-protein synthetase, LuxE
MTDLTGIESSIESAMAAPLYAQVPVQRQTRMLSLLKDELGYACQRSSRFRNYIEHWPVAYDTAESIVDLPFLPVSAFKANPPLTLVEAKEIVRTLSSSATSSQTPSRVALDRATSRRMTRSLTAVIRDFIGPDRRPYLVVDIPENLAPQAELGARAAAVQGLTSFATKIVSCLTADGICEPRLDVERILTFAREYGEREVLIYGFTYVIWNSMVLPLRREGKSLAMANARVLHSGGWKRLQEQAVTKEVFTQGVADTVGCSPARVIDYYGMVENVGVVYPDCAFGNKHVPAFAEVIVRDPLTLAPVKEGEKGLLQICSVLPTSFPGFLVLTDDLAEFRDYDGCPCGRRGTFFRFAGRVPKVEVRGCGNIEPARTGGIGAKDA